MYTFAVMEQNKNIRLLSWVILTLLTGIWGSSFILIKKGLVSFSPDQVGALRIISAGVFLLPVSLKNLRKYSRRNFKWLTSVGLVGSFIPAFLFATAQTQINSSLAGILNSLTPLFVLIIGIVFFKQKTRYTVLIGLFLGLVGCFLLISNGNNGFGDFNLYGLLIVVATVCYGANVNIIKYRLEGLSAQFITSASLLIVLPVASIYLFLFTPFLTVLKETEGAYLSLSYIVLLGVMGTSVALIMFNRLVQLTNPVFTSLVTYLMPIVAVGWGVIDHEVIRWIHLVGLGIIVLSVYLVNSGQRLNKY